MVRLQSPARCAGSVAIRSQLDNRIQDSVVSMIIKPGKGQPPGRVSIIAALRDHRPQVIWAAEYRYREN